MLRRLLSSTLALLLALAPAAAQDQFYQPFSRQPEIYRATCVSDVTDATTYNPVAFQAITIPGVHASDSVVVYVGVFMEDALATFGIGSMTVDGSAATEVVDEDGTGVVNTGFYRIGPVSNANIVDVSVTASEQVVSATVCVWAVRNLASATPTSTVVDDDTSSGALVLTTATTALGGFVMCISGQTSTVQTNTWAIVTTHGDEANADSGWSTATGNATGASMSNTSDWTSTNDASGACIAVR
jgi:hypothetical protein